MSKGIPKRPALLVDFFANLIAGDDKHQQDSPLPKDLRAELEATRAKLSSLNADVTTSRGQYRQRVADRRDGIKTATTQAEKFRDALYLQFGHKDEVLVDYGLAPRKKAHKAKAGEPASESASSKAEKTLERAQARLSRALTQLAKAKASVSHAKTVFAQRQAEAAKTQPVTPTEPTPTSEPTSESGTK